MGFNKKMKKYSKRKSRKAGKTTKLAKAYYDQALDSMPLQVLNAGKSDKVHKFKRSMLDLTSVTTLTSTNTWSAITTFPVYPASGVSSFNAIVGFSPNDMVQMSDFYNLFQRFRVRKIKYTFRCVDLPASSSIMPAIFVAKYTTGQYLGLTKNNVSSMSFCKKYQFSSEHREFSISYYPMLQTVSADNNAGTGVGSTNWAPYLSNKTWIDTGLLVSDTFTPVYQGLAVYFDNLTPASALSIVTDIEATIECKDLK